MNGLLERIQTGGILVADGAMGTMLFARGLTQGECPEAFNLSHPEVLEEIAALYLEAGADIVQTNTFGASPLKLAMYGLEDRTEEINLRAVEAVRRAAGNTALVSASCGPCGKILKPYGDAEPAQVYQGFIRQITAQAEAGADIICIETMTDLEEASLAVQAARAAAPGIPIMASMTFDRTPRGFFTIMGVTVQQAAGGLAEAGADIIGSNCGNGVENMISIAREFSSHCNLPLLIQSNAGLPATRGDSVIYPETPEFMAGKVPDLIETGVAVIGGCCGTTPAHIAAIKHAVLNRQAKAQTT